MRTHTNNFKSGIATFGRELENKITYTENLQTVELTSKDLYSVTPNLNTELLKSVMKQLTVESSTMIPKDTEINYKFGLKVGNSYEYIDFGNYIVYSVEKQEDMNNYKMVCYDKMLYSMKDYEDMEITYPITIRDYIGEICDYLGLTFKNASDTFVNYDKQIQKELYLDSDGKSLGYTFRAVLDELSQVVAGNICINESDDELEIRYINNTSDTINESYFKDINVNFGEKFGPVNSIVLSRADESDNVYLRDEQSVTQNGLCEIKIKDNQIMNFNDRADYLQDILTQLDGLEYYINDFSSPGIVYYQVCDKYNISIGENTYPCIMFNDELLVTQGLSENIHTERLEETTTEYKYASTDDRLINQAWIIVNKQESTIQELVSKTSILDDGVYTKEQVDNLLIDTEHGLTNTFSESGGSNIFRNTGLWFTTTDSNNPYEFWTGIVARQKEDKAVNRNALILQNGNLVQEQDVPNKKYTVSFTYKKLLSLAEVKVYINEIEYELTETTDTPFEQTIEVNSQHINIRFVCDVADGCEIYDLMVNIGDSKLAYSQNQNETTTNTVNISKGITITSSDLDVKFKADADGIRTLDNTDTIITKFTDTGMKTKEAIIESKSQIVGTLWQEVGQQTWITRL